MKRLAQLGFLVGFAAIIAAAYFLPWISYARYPSETTVVANGGRSEQFLIRLPSDQIHAAASAGIDGGAAAPALFGPAYPHTIGMSDQDAPSSVAHYKLRDVSGNVIGIAARHATVSEQGPVTAWMLVIPSRGAAYYSGQGDDAVAIGAALAAAGWQPGQTISTSASIDRGSVLATQHTSGEFSNIDFQLAETWEVTGIDADGQIRGTIQLGTIGRRRQ
jgi:hypothetical protein